MKTKIRYGVFKLGKISENPKTLCPTCNWVGRVNEGIEVQPNLAGRPQPVKEFVMQGANEVVCPKCRGRLLMEKPI